MFSTFFFVANILKWSPSLSHQHHCHPGCGSKNSPRPPSLYAAIENSHRAPQNGLFIATYGSVRFVVDGETDFCCLKYFIFWFMFQSGSFHHSPFYIIWFYWATIILHTQSHDLLIHGYILEGASQTKGILIDNKHDVDWSESNPYCNHGPWFMGHLMKYQFQSELEFNVILYPFPNLNVSCHVHLIIKSRKRMIKPHKVTSLVLMTSSDKILFDVPKCVSKTCDVIYFEVIGSVLDCSDEFNFKSECDLQCNEGYTKTNLYVQLKMIW